MVTRASVRPKLHRLGNRLRSPRHRLKAALAGRLGARPLRRWLAALAAVATVAAAGVAGQAAYSGGSSPVVVTAQPGDSLWAIAQRYHISVSQLAAANGMTLAQILPIGRRLVIPGTGSTASSGSSSPSGTASAVRLPSASTFCAGGFSAGPAGSLPGALAANPSLLALRPVFVRWSEDYGLAPSYVEAIAWVESGWQEGAVSRAHAVGVGQLLPSTAAQVNHTLGTNLSIASASDNIRMEAAYLAMLRNQVGDSLCLMTAAYNEGPSNLIRVGVFPETQQYVRDVLYDQPRFA